MSDVDTNKNVEISRSRSTAKALENLLLAGPMNSQQVVSTLKASGASAKQIRSAREHLGVVIKRQGNRRAMCSIWALPERTEGATSAKPGLEHKPDETLAKPGAIAAEGRALDGSVNHPRPDSSAQVPSAAGGNFTRRVDFLRARGMDEGEALDLATELEMRDQASGTSVSCIECQCWTQTSWCPVRRPAKELHHCSTVRKVGP